MGERAARPDAETMDELVVVVVSSQVVALAVASAARKGSTRADRDNYGKIGAKVWEMSDVDGCEIDGLLFREKNFFF